MPGALLDAARSQLTRLCTGSRLCAIQPVAVAQRAGARSIAAAAAPSAARPAAPAPPRSPAPRAAQPAATARAFSSGSSGQPGAMPLQYRPPIVQRASAKHTGTVIMLHGLGDSGDGWAGIADEFSAALPQTKFIFPHAPLRPISINMGMRMPGWYDIKSLEDINQQEDAEGLQESKRYIESLVAAEAAEGVPSNRVIVAGFSQGGAVALMMLRSEHKLAGVIGLSTYLPLRKDGSPISGANKQTPILMCHGDADMVVNYSFGVNTFNALKEMGADVELKTYRGMGHSAVPSELQAVQAFIAEKLPPQ